MFPFLKKCESFFYFRFIYRQTCTYDPPSRSINHFLYIVEFHRPIKNDFSFIPFFFQLAVKLPSSTPWCQQQWRIQCLGPVRKEPSNLALATTVNEARREPTGNGAAARTTFNSALNSLVSLSTPERKAATSVTWWTCTTTKPVEW